MSRGGFGRGRGGGGRGNFNRGGGGGFRGRGGGGNFRGRGGGRNFDTGPPEYVKELGFFMHPCQDDLVCKSILDDVPFFNAPIYLENKQQIGKIDEIYGPIKNYYVSVKLSEDVKANSFEKDQKIYIDPAKLLPLTRFLPRPPGAPKPRGGRGGGRGRGGGGRGRGFGRGGGGGFGRGGGDRNSFGRGRGGDRNSFGRGGDRNSFGRGGDRNSFGRGGGDRNSFGRGGGDRNSFGRGGGDRNSFGRGGGGGFKRERDSSEGGGFNKKIKFDS